MSLTSYRAAPPRGRGRRTAKGVWRREQRPSLRHAPFAGAKRLVLGGPGNDLLSRVLRHSTIGAEEFNGRVRDGIGFLAPRSSHRTGKGQGKQKVRDQRSDVRSE